MCYVTTPLRFSYHPFAADANANTVSSLKTESQCPCMETHPVSVCLCVHIYVFGLHLLCENKQKQKIRHSNVFTENKHI